MILFIIIAICILAWTIFDNDGLLDCIRRVESKTKTIRELLNDIGALTFINILLNVLNFFGVFFISMLMVLVLHNTRPIETSHWQFNINAMQDNLVTEGTFAYRGKGHVDGELSYFYSRTLSHGEKIEHIPASKTYIRYSDTEHPHVEVHERCIDIPDWMYKVFFLKSMNDKTLDYYVIVVPEGTITNTGQYEIDMK